MTTYRTGNHWGVTIVREDLPPDANGDNSELVAVVVNGDQALAERICALLNGEPETLPPAQCGCPVERRRARVESHTRECGQRAAAARIAADLAWIADSEGEL